MTWPNLRSDKPVFWRAGQASMFVISPQVTPMSHQVSEPLGWMIIHSPVLPNESMMAVFWEMELCYSEAQG